MGLTKIIILTSILRVAYDLPSKQLKKRAIILGPKACGDF